MTHLERVAYIEASIVWGEVKCYHIGLETTAECYVFVANAQAYFGAAALLLKNFN